MFKNYLKIALRNLWRRKTYTVINVMGLAVGMAASFLIYLYVHFEMSYDTFHAKSGRIYRLVCDTKTSAGIRQGFATSWPMGPALKAEFPEVEKVVRMTRTNALVKSDQIKIMENQYGQADSSLFSVFDFPLLKGNPLTALKQPGSLVISETAARKYFGDGDPIGQQLEIETGRWIATVTGVMKDIPDNSLVRASMFFSLTPSGADLKRGEPGWGGFGNLTYVLLKQGADPKALEAKLPAFLERHMSQQMRERDEYYSLSLEPLNEVHLHSNRGGNDGGNMGNLYVFSVIALLILLIACFNFINLTTAHASDRGKEIGIRKVTGAAKTQLIGQFVLESILVCFCAFWVALVLIDLSLPLFNQISGKTLSRSGLQNVNSIAALFGVAVGIGSLAGTYPAFVLSSFNPVSVLKGQFTSGVRGAMLRKSLVIVQFAISMMLIISTLVIYSQLRYMRSQDLGINFEQTMLIDTHHDASQLTLKQEVLNIPTVRSATLSWGILGEYPYTLKVEDLSGGMLAGEVGWRNVDFEFIKQYNIKIVAGRSFSKDLKTDSSHALILNEAAVKLFGYPSPGQIIGRKFISPWGNSGVIIGVAKDFHYVGLREKIKPLCLDVSAGYDLLSVKVETGNLPATIATIEKKYKALIPDWPFDYYFADEFFDRQYRTESRFGSLFQCFATLAIFLSCLGIFGLASFNTIKRTKEIGIRKVLGASALDIVALLSNGFFVQVIISFLIASPIAWFLMNNWLEGFAYRINIPWWIFAVAGLAVIAVTLITVSFQTVKAAATNPVKTLKSE